MVKKPEHDYAGENYGHHGTSYSFESVIGDLIDNSIDAGAKEVSVQITDQEYPEQKVGVNENNYPQGLPFLSGKHLYAMVVDNGNGMSPEELADAIVMGKRREYQEYDLGHYGVGMKQSSLSQAYEMTIFTKSKKGTTSILRLSSSWIQDKQDEGWMEVKDMKGEYAWMKETQGFRFAKEELDNTKSGTVILLEGLHKLEARIAKEERDTSIALIRDRVEQYLRLVFSEYIKEGGADIPLSKPIKKKMTFNRTLNISVLNKKLKSLDPFYRDCQGNQYGTLTGAFSAKTNVGDEMSDMDVQIWIIPNRAHPSYKSKVEGREKKLQNSREDLNAQKLQGLFIYRNLRLIDYGVDQWKGIRTEDPGQTMHRWEVRLPPGINVGNIGMSDFLVNNTKSEVDIDEDMKTRLKTLSTESGRKWHEEDPDYDITAMTRAQIRNKKEGKNQPLTARFPSCKHCKTIKHRTIDHRCPDCGNKGHGDKTSERCRHYKPPPTPPPPPPLICDDCGKTGHNSKDSPFCDEYHVPDPPDPLPPEFEYIFSTRVSGELMDTRVSGNVTDLSVNIRHEHFEAFWDHLNFTLQNAILEDEEE